MGQNVDQTSNKRIKLGSDDSKGEFGMFSSIISFILIEQN